MSVQVHNHVNQFVKSQNSVDTKSYIEGYQAFFNNRGFFQSLAKHSLFSNFFSFGKMRQPKETIVQQGPCYAHHFPRHKPGCNGCFVPGCPGMCICTQRLR